MAKKLYMNFSVNGGKDDKALSITDPAEALTRAQVEAAAAVLVSTKALNVNGVVVDGFKGAEYKETVVEAIEA